MSGASSETGRAVMGIATAALAIGLPLAGCGGSDSGPPPAPKRPKLSVDHAVTCELLEVPLATMAKYHLTFATVAERPAGKDRGIGPLLAFLMPTAEGEIGEFAPILRYLAQRGAAEAEGDPGPVAPASAAQLRNARELDRFVARGTCR